MPMSANWNGIGLEKKKTQPEQQHRALPNVTETGASQKNGKINRNDWAIRGNMFFE